MKATAALLQSFIASSPTSAARTLLNDQHLYARAGNGFIEVWKCLPVSTNSVTFQQQTTDCTEEIPISFTLSDGGNYTGFLNPVTMIITHHGTPASCKTHRFTPLQWSGRLGSYHRHEGALYHVGNVSSLQVLHYHTHEGGHYAETLIPKIYTPLSSYSWSELAPIDDTNALLASVAAQAEAIELLTAPLYSSAGVSNTDDKTNRRAANIVTRGLYYVEHLFLSPFHTWVLITCLTANVCVLYRLLKRCKCYTRSKRLVIYARQRLTTRRTPPPPQTEAIRNLRQALTDVEAAEPPENEPMTSETEQLPSVMEMDQPTSTTTVLPTAATTSISKKLH